MVSSNLCHPIKACRICRSEKLAEVIDVGLQALTGRFPGADEPDPPSAPMIMLRCECCGLVQLRHSVSLDELFTSNYGYRSGLNATMTRHLAGVADSVMSRIALRSGDVVLDIGCNDGSLLKNYPAGTVRIGIDPLVEKFRGFYPPEFIVAADFFNAGTFARLCPDRKARVISSIAMFYDLEDPSAFVGDIAASLADDGLWVMEQSYMPQMLQLNSYDTICHEHLEYYALRQIEHLAELHGLRVFDVMVNASNGGSFRVFLCHGAAPYPTSSSVVEMREAELALGLDGPAPFDAFRERCMRLRAELREFVQREVAAGKVFYLYGASTKGNTILQYCGLDHTLIRGAAERNPEKWGARTPGTAIPIVSEEEARAAKPDYFLVLPWHFGDEFIKREAAFRQGGGKLVFPLPTLRIVE